MTERTKPIEPSKSPSHGKPGKIEKSDIRELTDAELDQVTGGSSNAGGGGGKIAFQHDG